ncbi:FAD-dependent oxidoreductase [Pusillimonas minor]|uniref:FAD-dependent monooxygenase n=1 Tax=Pusillimonas minor TaxID=2697024 RepID=A0A842HSB2_9BURK|nr:FAD-dependent monooxygenase [Pusillimonas minor]MBC2770121.1 FAD-dependent monooxygenase [Pusillimonas minor]
MSNHPIIISGGGPVGLVAALSLAEKGLDVVILESSPEIPTDLRAGTFHPPTVEMLDTLSIGQELLNMGIKVPEWQIRDRKQGLVAQFDLNLIADETPYPFRLHCEQHKLSHLAFKALQKYPNARVMFGHTCSSYTQDEDGVTVQAESANGDTVELRGSYLLGCDGVRSIVRKTADIEFEGFTWPERFLVFATTFDLKKHGFTGNAYIADPDEWAAIFVQPHDGPPGIYRIAFPIKPEQDEAEVLSDDYVQSRIQGFLSPDQTYEIPYRSVYRVHQRVAQSFRKGRIALAGDAAHVNNPLGGMGLNSGIHDAINLADKLARIVLDGAPEALLDQYDRQRRLTNIEYVQAITIRNKKMLEERDPQIRAERLQEMRDTAADPEKHRAFLMNSSMINSVRRAAQID